MVSLASATLVLLVIGGFAMAESAAAGGASAQQPPQLRVGQAGYPVGGRKVIILAGELPDGAHLLVRNDHGGEVLRAKVGAAALDADSAELLRSVDLSLLGESGKFSLEIGETRCEIVLADDVWRRPLMLAMRSFYGQRCGTAVSMAPEFPEYHHPACHTAKSPYHSSSGTTGDRDCVGGWHDAGDYGKYVVNSNITVGTLLWCWELQAAKLAQLKLDIPETGKPLPDFLAEVKWNLDWMLKMQDVEDGGVYHKATTERFPGMVMPSDDTQPVMVVGLGQKPWKNTTATAGFAAVTAVAARTYAPFDPDYARRNLDASEKAFTWAVANPNALYRQNPPGIHTGGYGDEDAGDEILWAAAELFRTTGKPEYDAYFRANYSRWKIKHDAPQGWQDVSNLALFTYAMATGASAEIVAEITTDAVSAADTIAQRSEVNGYHVPLLAKDYNWGSNSVLLNYAMMVQLADRLAPNPKYRAAVEEMLHYIFGRNTFSTSFVTHVGTKSAMRPHHRPSHADGVDKPWPGLLAGGPNHRDYNREKQTNMPPAKAWTDEMESFTTNENAINWNAALVFVLAGAAK